MSIQLTAVRFRFRFALAGRVVRTSLAGVELLPGLPPLLLEAGQAAPHLLPLLLQAVALLRVEPHVRLRAVLAEFYLDRSGTAFKDTQERFEGAGNIQVLVILLEYREKVDLFH